MKYKIKLFIEIQDLYRNKDDFRFSDTIFEKNCNLKDCIFNKYIGEIYILADIK